MAAKMTTTKVFEDIAKHKYVTEFDFDPNKKCKYVWKDYGYFGSRSCSLKLERFNLPENTIFYVNQCFYEWAENKTHHNDIFIIGQIIPFLNQPTNIHEYVPKDNEVKILIPKYNTLTDEFLFLEYCLANLVVWGDIPERFFDYGCVKENKYFYNTSKKLIPNFFKTEVFSYEKYQYQDQFRDTDFSNQLFFFYRPL